MIPRVPKTETNKGNAYPGWFLSSRVVLYYYSVLSLINTYTGPISSPSHTLQQLHDQSVERRQPFLYRGI